MAPSRGALFTLTCLLASGCFATHDESLGETSHDAARGAEASAPQRGDAEAEDATPASDPRLPALDATPAQPDDAGAPMIDLDAGHDASDGDAGHASDAARDARTGCREPWEPWECRG